MLLTSYVHPQILKNVYLIDYFEALNSRSNLGSCMMYKGYAAHVLKASHRLRNDELCKDVQKANI
jgi:hypothetical protein